MPCSLMKIRSSSRLIRRPPTAKRRKVSRMKCIRLGTVSLPKQSVLFVIPSQETTSDREQTAEYRLKLITWNLVLRELAIDFRLFKDTFRPEIEQREYFCTWTIYLTVSQYKSIHYQLKSISGTTNRAFWGFRRISGCPTATRARNPF